MMVIAPCPCCGGDAGAQVVRVPGIHGASDNVFKIICTVCGLQTRGVTEYYHGTKDECVSHELAKWNERI